MRRLLVLPIELVKSAAAALGLRGSLARTAQGKRDQGANDPRAATAAPAVCHDLGEAARCGVVDHQGVERLHGTEP